MANTLGDVKLAVANQLGATNGNVSVPKRDTCINDARREYYNAARWSFCFRTASVTLTAQVGSLPTNYNSKYSPVCVYSYSGNVKTEFMQVPWDDLGQYTTGSYVYAINRQTSQIKINDNTLATVTVDYYQLPADAALDTTGDATAELAPDITAIVMNAIGRWWLVAERNTANYDRFRDMYREQLFMDKKMDMQNKPPKSLNLNRLRQGYNKGYGTRAVTGYRGNV